MTADTSIVDRDAPYRDADLPIEDRVEDLLARMLPEEKVAQLGSAWMFELVRGDEIDDDRASAICRHGLGQITRIAGASTLTADKVAGVANALQRRLVEGTRLGIPAIVHEEICSGLMARGSTVYPQAIGVASTFEPDLNAAMADGIRVQMRKAGAHQGLSPVLDVVRDPRWGRTEETYGEDPYLVARMGTAFVEGLQGPDLAAGVIATAKHFVGYGASEGGMNWAPAHVPDRELREVFLHPFEAAVRVGGLASVMNGYHELDGVPCAANEQLLNGILRGSWGFDGIVVADYFSVDQLAAYHGLARSKSEAAVLALGAGIDVELPSSDCFAEPLLRAVESGDADTAALDDALRRILRLKFALGLFERPYVDASEAIAAVDTDAHRSLAATIARKSLVLLRNEGVLPLGPAPGTIAVIGPNADEARHLLGDYAYPAHIESLKEMGGEESVVRRPGSGRPRPGSRRGARPLRSGGADGDVRRRRPPRPRLRRERRRHQRLRRGSRARSGVRRRRARRRRQGRADAELHERGGTRPVLAGAPGCPGGSRSRRSRDGDAGGHGSGRRASLRQRGAASAVGRRAARVAARPGRRRCHRRDARGNDQPRREAADLVPPLGRPAPGLLRPQGLRRQVALARRVRRRGNVAALPVRTRPQLHDVRARRSRRPDADGGTGRLDHRVGVDREHRAASPARR